MRSRSNRQDQADAQLELKLFAREPSLEPRVARTGFNRRGIRLVSKVGCLTEIDLMKRVGLTSAEEYHRAYCE